MNFKKFLLISIFSSLFSIVGFFVGIEYLKTKNLEKPNLIKIEKSYIPTLSLEKIENGILYIKHLDKEVRIKIKNDIYISNNNELQVPVKEILPFLKTLPAPKNMKFVASSRGKNYYALDNPKAFLISVKNRIFFKTKEAAEKSGKKGG
jgi:hypothetical protein